MPADAHRFRAIFSKKGEGFASHPDRCGWQYACAPHRAGLVQRSERLLDRCLGKDLSPYRRNEIQPPPLGHTIEAVGWPDRARVAGSIFTGCALLHIGLRVMDGYELLEHLSVMMHSLAMPNGPILKRAAKRPFLHHLADP
jgi:hypothetical protein